MGGYHAVLAFVRRIFRAGSTNYVMQNSPIFHVIIVIIIIGTGDIKAFIALGALGIMMLGKIEASLEDICKRFPANT